MRLLTIALMIYAVSLTSCASWRASPEPCDCGVAEKETRAYTLKYFDAMEDVGNLRHQLKACEERRN